MTPAPSSPVPAVEAPVDHDAGRVELPGEYVFRLFHDSADGPFWLLFDPDHKPIGGAFDEPEMRAFAVAMSPTPGRAAEPDTMVDAPGAMTAQQVFAWAKEKITALRTRAETAEAQLATLRAERDTFHRALTAANHIVAAHEPRHSQAVSDIAVALAMTSAGLTDTACEAVIHDFITQQGDAAAAASLSTSGADR